MDHVLWIGGPPGSGKTMVARRIARRHGLRLFSTDTRTWPHRDRALAAGVPAARRWEALRPADDWTGVSDADQLAMSLHAERGRMVLDDLATLPHVPLVLVEGSVLPAWAADAGVSDPTRAVWLVPTPEEQAAHLGVRGEPEGRMRLQAVLRDVIADEVEQERLPALHLDGSLDLDGLAAAVEGRLAGRLAAGPTAEGRDERRALLQKANAALVAQARDFHARLWATGRAEDRRFVFSCECGDPACDGDLDRTVGDYLAAAPLLLAPGHRA